MSRSENNYNEIVPLDDLATRLFDGDGTGWLDRDREDPLAPAPAKALLGEVVGLLVADRASRREYANGAEDDRGEEKAALFRRHFEALVEPTLLAALAPVTYESDPVARFTAEGVRWAVTGPSFGEGDPSEDKRGWLILGRWEGQEDRDDGENLLFGPVLERYSTKNRDKDPYVLDSSAGARLPALIVSALAQAREQRPAFEEALRAEARRAEERLDAIPTDPYRAGCKVGVEVVAPATERLFYAEVVSSDDYTVTLREPGGAVYGLPRMLVVLRPMPLRQWLKLVDRHAAR